MDYTATAAKALTMLNKYGMAMTLRRQTAGTFNPSTGAFTGAATTDYTVQGLIQSQTLQTAGAGERFFNGTLIQAGDKFILLAASGLAVVPSPGDLLIIGSITFNIATIIPLEPGGTALMYRALVRK
jgi:hypothetical protein